MKNKMSVIRLLKRTANTVVSVVMLSGLLVAMGEAAVMEIEAKFSPDPSNPLVNKFINTTKFTGFCATAEAACKRLGISSFTTPITFTATKPLLANEPNPREVAMFSVPAQWRTLTVTKVGGEGPAETAEVKVRIPGISIRYRLSHTVAELVGSPGMDHSPLWQGGDWTRPPSPCRWTLGASFDSREFLTFWFTPAGSVCHKTPNYTIPGFDYKTFDFAYELETPEPLKMSQGTYTGSIQYTVGPGMDFDMGDVMLPSEDSLVINFTLTVEHMLKVEVPPGGNHVELVPQGGWQAWLNQGRKPTRLFRDQTFHISASSRFRMSLECGLNLGNTCGLQNAALQKVPLDVLVSLPSGLTDRNGLPVRRQPLRLDGIGTEMFQPGFYVDRKPGILHFEIQRDDVEQMLSREAATYKGDVTIIWDSEV